MTRTISLDTETTGCDYFHGAMPYIVTTCCDGAITFFEWDVDPLTREPAVPDGDVAHIRRIMDAAEVIWFQSPKFDAHILHTISVETPWHKVRDTLRGGHILASNHPHNLTDMCVECLGVDILPKETAVKKATQEARRMVRAEQKRAVERNVGLEVASRERGGHLDLSDMKDYRRPCGGRFDGWRLAEEGEPDMPSVSNGSKRDEDKPWKADMWLLRALVKQAVADVLGMQMEEFTLADVDADVVLAACDGAGYPREWLTLAADYANTDSEVTLPLGLYVEAEIRRRGLWDIYLHTLELPRIAYEMERRGVTISAEQTDKQIELYGREAEDAQATCVAIAADLGHDLELPAGASPNDSIREFFWGSCRLECPRCGTTYKHKEWSGPLPPEKETCAKCFKKGVGVACNVHRNPCLDLPLLYNAKSAGPTLDRGAMEEYEATLDDGPALEFIRALKGMRSRQTAVSYMQGYKRFW